MAIRDFLFVNKTDKQTLFKNTFGYFFAEGVNKGLMLLLIILLARYLGAEDYGKYAFAISLLSITGAALTTIASEAMLTFFYFKDGTDEITRA